MKRIGKESESEQVWDQLAAEYVGKLDGDYRLDRLRAIASLIPTELYSPGKRVLDFGCGDGIHIVPLNQAGADAIGIDISDEMVRLAHARLARHGLPLDLVIRGGVEPLHSLGDASLDGLLSFNVLAYLTDEEEAAFYREAHRLLKPGGCLAVTHSNELFDLFSLNLHTVEFYATHFNSDIRSLLNADEEKERAPYNVRENPLTYGAKLLNHGFQEVRRAYNNLHSNPPALLRGRSYPNAQAVPPDEQWKNIFRCSTFGVTAVRVP